MARQNWQYCGNPIDIFPYEFYKIVPPGLTLMQTTLSIHIMNAQELAAGFEAMERVAFSETSGSGTTDIPRHPNEATVEEIPVALRAPSIF